MVSVLLVCIFEYANINLIEVQSHPLTLPLRRNHFAGDYGRNMCALRPRCDDGISNPQRVMCFYLVRQPLCSEATPSKRQPRVETI